MPSEPITDPIVLQGLIVMLLNRIAVEQRPCRLCGEQIYLVPVQDAAKRIWYSKNGNVHAQYCGNQRTPAKQPALFDTSPDPL